MKQFLIYANIHKDVNGTVTGRIKEYLSARGATVEVMTGGEAFSEQMKQSQCMIVLGGDGTVLQAAREASPYQIPMIGVNLGTLGYMTSVEVSEVESAMDKLLEDQYFLEPRMMLEGRMVSGKEAGKTDQALNDIVITRRGSLQILQLHVYVNGQFLHSYSGDGVIITTPTGSTGYNLSAGGPIVEPKARLIVLTPICPHSLNQRSIVLSAEDIVEIEVAEGREGRKPWAEVGFDGGGTIPMGAGDRIRITQAEKSTELIQLTQISFLEVLHQKMNEGK